MLGVKRVLLALRDFVPLNLFKAARREISDRTVHAGELLDKEGNQVATLLRQKLLDGLVEVTPGFKSQLGPRLGEQLGILVGRRV